MKIFVLFIETRDIVSIPVEDQFMYSGLWLAVGHVYHLISLPFLDMHAYVLFCARINIFLSLSILKSAHFGAINWDQLIFGAFYMAL